MLYLILLLVVASLGLLIAALTTANTLWAWISVLISVVAAGLLVLDWIQNRRRRSREAPAAGRRPESLPSGPVFEEREQPFAAASSSPGLLPVGPPSHEQTVTPQEQSVTSQERSGDEFPDAFEESFRDFDDQPTYAEPNRGRTHLDGPKLGEPPFGTASQVPDEAIPQRMAAIQEPITAIQEPITAIQGPVVDPDSEPGEENTDATDVLTVSELSDEVVVIDERPRYHLVTCAWLNGRPTMSLPVSEARELGFTPCALCAPDSTLAARQRARY